MVSFREIFPEHSLGEEVSILLAVLVCELVAYNRAGIAPVGEIGVELGAPVSVFHIAVESVLDAQRVHVSVLAYRGGVVSAFCGIAELVFSGGVHVFRAE